MWNFWLLILCFSSFPFIFYILLYVSSFFAFHLFLFISLLSAEIPCSIFLGMVCGWHRSKNRKRKIFKWMKSKWIFLCFRHWLFSFLLLVGSGQPPPPPSFSYSKQKQKFPLSTLNSKNYKFIIIWIGNKSYFCHLPVSLLFGGVLGWQPLFHSLLPEA